jgi:type IX secretion system PorP/SprF family membrane protein
MPYTSNSFLKLHALGIVMVFNSALFAQQNSVFNAYSYDLMQVNVAAMGSSCFEANLNYRSALINVTNAPTLYQLNSYVRLGNKQAVGVKLYQNSVGLYQFSNITGAYAYKLKLSKEANLSFGLGVSFYQARFNAQRAVVPDYDDPNLENDGSALRGNNFDCEAGTELNVKGFKAGFSVNHLYNTNKNVGNSQFKTTQEFNVYVMDTLKLSSNFELMPWLLSRYNAAANTFIPEIMINTRFKKTISLGVGYRYPRALITNLSAEIKGLKMVYSFEYNFQEITKVFGTTHQILLGFDLCQKKRK